MAFSEANLKPSVRVCSRLPGEPYPYFLAVPVLDGFGEIRLTLLGGMAGTTGLEPAMKLVGPLAAGSPGLRLDFALEIQRHCGADEILQGRLIDLVAFVDVDGAPDISLEAGVE
jgi:hypothetical protein